MDITAYTGRLKRLADALRDIGQPVRETSQVLNMLRGLSPKYRHTVPVITAKNPPHTCLSTRSYLLLEEQYNTEHTKSATQHTLLAAAGSRPPALVSGSGATSAPRSSQPTTGTNASSDNRGNKKHRGRGNNSSAGPSGGGHATQGGFAGQRPPSSSWTPCFNPWTSMVQAWPMSFRVPGAGVLGPRPSAPPQQAYIARPTHHHPSASIPAPASSSSDVWNQQALLAALATTSVSANGPQASEWFLDTGATSHMVSGSDNFPSARPLPHSAPITVGNGASMPVTHAAHSSIPGTTFISTMFSSPPIWLRI
jgi:hypothetical protein